MSNHIAGHNAEKRAAVYLQSQGFTIHELNWKTKYCEIDIIAQKDSAMYFVEVKYRRTSNQGYGLDYITQKKLKSKCTLRQRCGCSSTIGVATTS